MIFAFEHVLMHLRKSRADLEAEARGEGETLAKHEKFLLKFAKDNKINIINIRRELESGESLIHRPLMQQTLEEVKQGLYDGVLCMDIDRLGRGNMQDQGAILDAFKGSNTKIITPRKVYDLHDEWDEEYVEFEEFMARKELKYINRRLQRGRVGSVDEGNYIGTRPPYGYVIESKGKKDRYLVPHPEQAPVVQMIFELYTSDDPDMRMGANKIANELNRLGYKTATNRGWKNSSVLFIIKNAVYAGRIQWKKKEIKKSIRPDKKKETRTRPRSEWIDVEGKHEPLISMETYEKAQEILRKKYHVPYRLQNGITNPMAGLIKCSLCGSSMVLRPYKNQQPHIICYNTRCVNKSTRFEYVENRIIEGLRLWKEKYKAELSKRKTERKTTNIIDIKKKALQRLEKEFTETLSQKDRLHDLLERGIYNTETFLERSQVIAEKLHNIRETINDTQKSIDEEKQNKKAREEIIPEVENVLDLYYKTENPAKRNSLLKSVLEYAEYRKEKHQHDDDFALVLHPKLAQINRKGE